MSHPLWRSDALADVQRMINRTLHGPHFYPPNIRGRNFIPPEENTQQHPFKLTLMGARYKITGGYVFGYDDCTYLQDAEFDVAEDGVFVSIAVEPNAIDRDVKAWFAFGKRSYWEHPVYYYPLAEINENGEVIQYQVGNLVTPFQRVYFPVIKGSLNNLIMVKEGEGDEVDFKLKTQGKVEVETGELWTGPYANQHLCTNSDTELCWKGISDSSSSTTSSSSTISSSSSGMIDDLDDLEPGKWYVFIRYYRNEGETEISYQGYKYNTREGFHTEGWGTELARWVRDEYDMGDGLLYVAGYYFNAVAGGPFDTILAADSWWREHEWEYDPNVARPA